MWKSLNCIFSTSGIEKRTKRCRNDKTNRTKKPEVENRKYKLNKPLSLSRNIKNEKSRKSRKLLKNQKLKQC